MTIEQHFWVAGALIGFILTVPWLVLAFIIGRRRL